MEQVGIADLGIIAGQAAAVTLSINQFLKQLPFIKNRWVNLLGPIVAVLFGFGWYLAATGGWLAIYQVLSACFAAHSLGAQPTYAVSKALAGRTGIALLPPGPDNSPGDMAPSAFPAHIPNSNKGESP